MALTSFSTVEVAHATGFSVKQLDYWACRGIVIPSIQQSHGPGTRKRYSVDDLVKLQFIRQLKHYGWSIQKIGRAIKTLGVIIDDPDPLKHAVLIHGKNTLIALCKTKEGERIVIDALSVGGQQIMGVVLEMLIEEAQQIVNRMNEYTMNEETIV